MYDEGISKITVGITPILAEQLKMNTKRRFCNLSSSRIEAVAEDLDGINDSVAHSQHLKFLAKYTLMVFKY
jgi:predicted glycosyl hydrolase (DUF1957 family)